MNLSSVIDGLVEERGLGKEEIILAVCDGVLAAFNKKFPEAKLEALYNKKLGEVEVFAEKEVVTSVDNENSQISLRKAKVIDTKVSLGDFIKVPFEHEIGRIEILTAKQFIANKIRGLEQSVTHKEFIDKKGTIVSGVLHKKERDGLSVKLGEVLAILPVENFIPHEVLKVGHPVRALLKEVLPVSRGDYQLILDRASSDFVQRLIEIEIPEVFEGIVEIKKVVRIAGYKTKMIVASNNSEIDPVGTCVGVGGVRIKPILRELGQEKIDLIESTESLESLVKNSLKPAEIDKVEIIDNEKALVWLAQDQRSLAIGRLGQNISLASKLLDLDIQLQDIGLVDKKVESFSENED